MQPITAEAAVFEPVRTSTAFEETVARLGTAIKIWLLAEGARLPPERALAKQLAISRFTLRQAINALTDSGHSAVGMPIGQTSYYNGHMNALTSLAADVGAHERTLRRAVRQGTLRGVWRTPRTLVLSLGESRYVRHAWPLLSSLRGALRTEPNVRFALLFGSAASGMDTEGSDVDVLVDLHDSGLERVADLGTKLERTVGRRVDVVRLQDAELEPAFLADVVAAGRVLVDRETLWPRLRARESQLRRRGEVRHEQRVKGALAGIDRLLA